MKATSGKLDRSTLPDLAPDAAPDRELVAPRSEAERLVARAFSDHLRRGAPVSIEDDFFLDLGGNSLLAAQTVSTLRKSRAHRAADRARRLRGAHRRGPRRAG